jgi:hypothetical protein
MNRVIVIPVPPKHPRRWKWFQKAVEEVKKHSDDPMDLWYCLYLNDNCKTWKELKERMYERFPFLPEPEKYGYCSVCKKPLSRYDYGNSQGTHCADCFQKEVDAILWKQPKQTLAP